jgi:MYXO-CTERM domain-containing protein
MRSFLGFAALSSVILAAVPAAAGTLSVGPGQMYSKPCDAIAAAQDGDVIEVDAAGSYDGDTCAWSTDNLTVRGINGRAKIDLTGVTPSQQKGIFTIYAPNATIENFELSGAAISAGAGNNGAGIRHQGLNLTVRGCYFHDNQDGILGGPLSNGQPALGMGTVIIEDSEFSNNGAGDGFSHNMYIGEYGSFTLTGSWSHKANVGHLVKTRAHENYILYNRITGEDGTDSYEIDVPQGGKTYIIGNLVEQGPMTQNPAIITYAEESQANPVQELFVVNNSIVNDLGHGTFVHVAAAVTTPTVLENNIFVGMGTVCDQASAVQTTNFSGNPMFVDQANYDYHLTAGSPCVDHGTTPGMGDGYALAPTDEYVQPTSTEKRHTVGTIDIGAYELNGGGGAGGGGTTGSTTGTTSTGTTGTTSTGSASTGSTMGAGGGSTSSTGAGAGGSSGTESGSSSSGAPGSKSGCGCGVASDGTGSSAALVAAVAWMARRRRRRA